MKGMASNPEAENDLLTQDNLRLALRAHQLEAVCRRVLAAYEAEEREHGFPSNFELREAHIALRKLVFRSSPVSGEVAPPATGATDGRRSDLSPDAEPSTHTCSATQPSDNAESFSTAGANPREDFDARR